MGAKLFDMIGEISQYTETEVNKGIADKVNSNGTVKIESFCAIYGNHEDIKIFGNEREAQAYTTRLLRDRIGYTHVYIS